MKKVFKRAFFAAVFVSSVFSLCFAEVLNEEYKLLASDGRYGDYFGRSISIKSW